MAISAGSESEVRTAPSAFAPSAAYCWVVVLFLMLLYTCSFIDRQILSLLVKPIRADLGITDTEYSVLTGFAFVVMYSIVGIPLGWVVDRWSRRGVITIGVAVWSLMTAGCGLANSFWRLFVTRVGVGIGEATLSPGSYSLISDYFPRHKLSRALSVYALGIPIGSGIALVVGGSLIHSMEAIGPVHVPWIGVTKPWQMVFLVIGLPGLLLALLTMLIVKEPPRPKPTAAGLDAPEHSIAAAFIYLWQHRGLYVPLFSGMGFLAMYSYGSNAWYPSFLVRVHGFSIARAGLFLGLCTLVFGILGSVTAGFWADRLMARGRHDGQLLVTIVYGVCLSVCGVLSGIARPVWLSLAFIALACFFNNTVLGCIAAAVQTVTPERLRGQMAAFFLFTAAFIGVGFGPTAIAAATDHIFGYDNAVGYSLSLNALVFPLLGCAIFYCGRKAMRHRMETE